MKPLESWFVSKFSFGKVLTLCKFSLSRWLVLCLFHVIFTWSFKSCYYSSCIPLLNLHISSIYLMACDAHGKGCIRGIHVLCMIRHGHINLIKVHWHGHVHGVWFTMWAEHDLIPSLWGFCITLVLITHCILYALCMITGYVLEV